MAGNMITSYVKANSIHHSYQRAVTTHDTNNWEVWLCAPIIYWLFVWLIFQIRQWKRPVSLRWTLVGQFSFASSKSPILSLFNSFFRCAITLPMTSRVMPILWRMVLRPTTILPATWVCIFDAVAPCSRYIAVLFLIQSLCFVCSHGDKLCALPKTQYTCSPALLLCNHCSLLIADIIFLVNTFMNPVRHEACSVLDGHAFQLLARQRCLPQYQLRLLVRARRYSFSSFFVCATVVVLFWVIVLACVPQF